MEKNKEKVSKKVWISALILSVLVIVIISLAVYIYLNAPKKVKKETLDGGSISLTYTDDLCGLSISNMGYLTDKEGTKLDVASLYFDFSVAVNLEDARQVDYEIALVPEKTSTVDSKYMKVYLEKQKSGTYKEVLKPTFVELSKTQSELASPKESMVLYKETKTKSSNDNYRLRMWVSDKSEVQITPTDTYTAKVIVKGKAS